MPDVIDTRKVSGRRQLRFASLDDIRADGERLAQASNIKTLGNWSPGQVLEHVSIVMDKSMDGFEFKAPVMLRWMIRLGGFKKKLATTTMPAGFRFRGDAERFLMPRNVDFADGLAHLRASIDRLKREPRRFPNPFLGELTVDEWNTLHCRHSEMHFSFLVPAD